MRDSSPGRERHYQLPPELVIDRDEPDWDYQVIAVNRLDDNSRRFRKLKEQQKRQSTTAAAPQFALCTSNATACVSEQEEQSLFYHTFKTLPPKKKPDPPLMRTCAPDIMEEKQQRPDPPVTFRLPVATPWDDAFPMLSTSRKARRDPEPRVFEQPTPPRARRDPQAPRGRPASREVQSSRRAARDPAALPPTPPRRHKKKASSSKTLAVAKVPKEVAIRAPTPPKRSVASPPKRASPTPLPSAQSIVEELSELQDKLNTLKCAPIPPSSSPTSDQGSFWAATANTAAAAPPSSPTSDEDSFWTARNTAAASDSMNTRTIQLEDATFTLPSIQPPRKTVRFASKIVTDVKYRPKTLREEIHKLYFDNEELELLEQERCERIYEEQFEIIAQKGTAVSVAYPVVRKKKKESTDDDKPPGLIDLNSSSESNDSLVEI